jgi:hypothetical protein
MQWSSRLAVLGSLGLCLLSGRAEAQAERSVLDSLRSVAARISARLDSLEAGLCPLDIAAQPVKPPPTGNPAADSLATTLERLAHRIRALALAHCAALAPRPAARPDSAADELAALRAAAAAVAEPDTAPQMPAEFASRQRNLSALNPEISATGDIRLVARDESPQRDNAVAREFEFAFQAALDPYSHTKLFMSFEDEEIGIEEGYVYWTGLPGRFRLDVGKFRQQVGELNRWHLHALPESEYPLVYRRFLGPEGLSGIGLGLYTSLPFSLARGTHEVFIQGTTAESDPLFAEGRQPTVLGRLQNFWQLSRSTYLQLGVTGLAGNNSDAELRSRLLGADLRFTYRPPNEATRRDLTLRLEGYRLHATEQDEVTDRYGGFADVQFRASRRWVLGTRVDYVEAPRGTYADEWEIAPTITWWQSEFVYLRLQGERNRSLGLSRNTLSLQVVWAMGPHKHETF